jgi:hypothetical protein
MYLYSFSNELHTYVEARWAKTKLIIGGIVIGTMIFVGFTEMNQSLFSSPGARPASKLASENGLLRNQLSLISPRVRDLEIRARESAEQADKLYLFLPRRNIVGHRVSSSTNATKSNKSKSLIAAARNLRP